MKKTLFILIIILLYSCDSKTQGNDKGNFVSDITYIDSLVSNTKDVIKYTLSHPVEPAEYFEIETDSIFVFGFSAGDVGSKLVESKFYFINQKLVYSKVEENNFKYLLEPEGYAWDSNNIKYTLFANDTYRSIDSIYITIDTTSTLTTGGNNIDSLLNSNPYYESMNYSQKALIHLNKSSFDITLDPNRTDTYTLFLKDKTSKLILSCKNEQIEYVILNEDYEPITSGKISKHTEVDLTGYNKIVLELNSRTERNQSVKIEYVD